MDQCRGTRKADDITPGQGTKEEDSFACHPCRTRESLWHCTPLLPSHCAHSCQSEHAYLSRSPLQWTVRGSVQTAHLAVDAVIAVSGHCPDLVAGIYILHVYALHEHGTSGNQYAHRS